MARGTRKHPTESLGIHPMSEINTVHAFGSNGQETSGWPYKPTSVIGTPVGPYLYRPARLSQNELGAKGRKPYRPVKGMSSKTRRRRK